MPTATDEKYQEFKVVFQQYYNLLCNYAGTFINDQDTREDIVQEIFIKVWENRRDLIGSDALRFYLFTAVRNNCLTYISKSRKHSWEPIESLSNEPHEQPGEALQNNTDYPALVKKALSLLPPKCKEVFLLSRISNLSYREIAEMLNISKKTVEHQVGKALKVMRNFVQENRLFTFAVLIFIFSLERFGIGGLLKQVFY